jgi:hypothetical protein
MTIRDIFNWILDIHVLTVVQTVVAILLVATGARAAYWLSGGGR